ncbi:MAG: PIN domain-containing protein [Lacunisphaera sp.]
MSFLAASSFVFVDFENVPSVDLGLVAGKAAHVTLMIGKNQTKIDFALVEQIQRLADQVELVKLDASGRNALDLTLANYLGRAIERRPDAHFCIVSKDKDFDPMIGHLVAKGIKVVRCDSFGALPFLSKSRKSGAAKASSSVKAAPTPKVPVAPKDLAADGRLEKLMLRLTNSLGPRPKKKAALLAHINTAYGNKLELIEQAAKLEELVQRGILAIDDAGRVTYAPVA